MNRYTTQGIVLTRTDFGEADRIITFLTPERGKVTAIAKGVRKSKSKLAGGIELFSVSDLTLLPGRGEIQTLMSTRLARHYGNIVKEIARTQAAYEIIRLINKATEEAPEPAYFHLLKKSFEALDNLDLDCKITELWFSIQLLKLAGHAPNLRTDTEGAKLQQARSYEFHYDEMRFVPHDSKQGSYTTNDVKFMRLVLQAATPKVLLRVENAAKLAARVQPITRSMLGSFVRA